MAQIKITLTKSPIGRIPSQRKTVVALGLGKLNSSVIKEDNPAVRGMITAVSHLVTVEEVKVFRGMRGSHPLKLNISIGEFVVRTPFPDYMR